MWARPGQITFPASTGADNPDGGVDTPPEEAGSVGEHEWVSLDVSGGAPTDIVSFDKVVFAQ